MGNQDTIKLDVNPSRSYAGSCIPQTLNLANEFKDYLSSKLADANIPEIWQFEDRIFIWLLPNFKKDVNNYYSEKGPNLYDMFQEHQIKHIDEELLRMLKEELENDKNLETKLNQIINK